MQVVKGRPLLYENRDIRLNVQIVFYQNLAIFKMFLVKKAGTSSDKILKALVLFVLTHMH